MLCAFPSTGELEQNLSFVQMFTTGRQSSTTPEHVRPGSFQTKQQCHVKMSNVLRRSLVKCRLDGLPVSDFVVSARTSLAEVVTLLPSQHCLLTQKKFRDLFGGGKRTERKSDLPRRSIPGSRQDPSSAKGRKRLREEEAAAVNAEAGPDQEYLRKTAADAASERESEKMLKLLQRLDKLSVAKKKQFENDMLPPGQGPNHAKYKEALKKEETLRTNLADLQDLFFKKTATASDCLTVDNGIFIAAAAVPDVAEQMFFLKTDVWNGTLEQCKQLLSARNVFWYFSTPEEEQQNVFPEQQQSWTPLMVACRLIGGCVVGPCWLEHCRASGELKRPLLHLKSALANPLEVCLHKSFCRSSEMETARTIALCEKAASHVSGRNLWIVRNKRKDLLFVSSSAYSILGVEGLIFLKSFCAKSRQILFLQQFEQSGRGRVAIAFGPKTS